jgi:hypothetical protein
MWTLTLTMYALILLGCIGAVSRRYQTFVNPVSYYGFLFGIQTLIAPLLLMHFGLFNMRDYGVQDLITAVWLSALYFVSICAAFLWKPSPFSRAFRFLLPEKPLRISRLMCFVTLGQFAALFPILMSASGAGTLWLSNPRLAYQTCREGAGLWWSLSQASLIVSFACTLFRKRRSIPRTLAIASGFGLIAYFLGSKGFVLNYFVISAFYIQYYVRPLTMRMLAPSAVIGIAGMVLLQIFQGTANTLIDTLRYFDYFGNTGRFLSDFGPLFQHAHGQVALSNAWYYVPRALFPDKPHVYGLSAIMDVYYPGAAEASGSTPGILLWAPSYWDFGWIGVALDGLFTGFIGRGAFDIWRRTPNVWSLLLFCQVGLLNGAMAFYNAPFPIFLAWMGAEYALLRLASIPLLRPINPVMVGESCTVASRDPFMCVEKAGLKQ